MFANSSNKLKGESKIEFQEQNKYLKTPKKIPKYVRKGDKNNLASESEYSSPLEKRPATS